MELINDPGEETGTGRRGGVKESESPETIRKVVSGVKWWLEC